MRHPDRHVANLRAIFALHGEGKLRPHVSRSYSLEEVPDALRAMDTRAVLGKVVIAP